MFDKSVVITGSSRGLGKALAEEFLRNGNRVVINSHNASNLQRAYRELYSKYGQRCEYVVGDVSRKHDSERIAQHAKASFGQVDIWINNAGSNGYRRGDVMSMTDKQVRNTVETNLMGTIYGSQAALSVIEEDGILVNLEGSGCDRMTSVPGYAVYESTKLGIKHFTECLQDEMEDTLFKIGTVSPGMVTTDMLMSDLTEDMRDMISIFATTPEKQSRYIFEEICDIRSPRFRIRYLTLLRMIYIALQHSL